MIALLLAVSMTLPEAPTTARADHYTWKQTLSAIRLVETGGEPRGGIGAKGDRDRHGNARALGPFQIWKPYWQDACEYSPPSLRQQGYEAVLTSRDYSERIVRAYMKRYAKEALARLERGEGSLSDVERISRIHNGGPKGYLKDATLKYWAKVQKEVKR